MFAIVDLKWRLVMKKILLLLLFITMIFVFTELPAKADDNIKLNKKKVTIVIGKTVKLKLSGADSVKWKSSDKTIATVSKTGKVKAKSEGKCTITAVYDGKSYSCKVTVKSAKSSTDAESGNIGTVDKKKDYIQYKFRSSNLLEQHYEKHGIEMGFDSKENYERAASDVINNPDSLHKTEKEDGDYVYYLEATNEFVVLSVDGYIRTYFLPSSGIKYYERQ